MSRLHQSKTKQTRLEQRSENRQRLANVLTGEGVFVYRNRNRNGTLELQKEVKNSRGQTTKHIEALEEFTSDNYFMGMVKDRYLTLVRVVEPPPDKNAVVQEAVEETKILSENQGDKMPDEEMLIVDQPDTITTHGKVEQVVKDPRKQKLNENKPATTTTHVTQGNVLLNENPLSGVEIL